MATNAPKGVDALLGSVRGWYARNTQSIVAVLAIILVWEFYTRFIRVEGDVFFPSPFHTIESGINNADKLITATQITLTEVAVGYVLIVLSGVVLGIIIGEFFLLRQAFFPMIVFGYTIPKGIVAPIFIVVLGKSLVSITLFIAFLGFFAVFVNTLTGISQMQKEFEYLGETFGATRWQMIKNIKIWTALPHIVAGMRIAVQQAFVGAIVAEFFATGGGMGGVLLIAQVQFETGVMFAVLIIIMAAAIVLLKFMDVVLNYVTPRPMEF